jgi:hypothetical protein
MRAGAQAFFLRRPRRALLTVPPVRDNFTLVRDLYIGFFADRQAVFFCPSAGRTAGIKACRPIGKNIERSKT